MSAPDLIRLFVQPLERLGVRYMITGGVAAPSDTFATWR